jgi:hypothetical protein
MNEDEKFFEQFHETPRPDFVDAVYKRINRNMAVQVKSISMRQMALSVAVVCGLLLATLFIYQPTRAQAFNLLRQIGAIKVTSEEPVTQQPTALPPDTAQKPITASSVAEASKLAGFQVLAPEWLPDGYTAEGGLNILPNGNGKTVVTGFTNNAKSNFILINQYRYEDGDSITDNVGGSETVRDVHVRGSEGVWITGRLMTNPVVAGQQGQDALRESSWLIWDENGIVYSVISDDLSLEATLWLAESLK